MKFGEKLEESYINSLRQSQNFQNNLGKDTQSKDDSKFQLPEPDHPDPKDQNGSKLPNLYSSLNLIEELENEIQQADSHLPPNPTIDAHHESSHQSEHHPELDKENSHPNTLSDTSSDHISSTILIDTNKRQEIISNIFFRDKLSKIPKLPPKKTHKKIT
jgi:DNA repair ATPase RecN